MVPYVTLADVVEVLCQVSNTYLAAHDPGHYAMPAYVHP